MAKDLKVPVAIVESDSLDSNSKFVLAHILAGSEYMTPEIMGANEIARALGMKVSQVKDALIELADQGMISLFSDPSAPEVSAYGATSIACHVQIRVELRKGIEKSGQKTMLDEAPVVSPENRLLIGGLPCEFEIKDDPEREEGSETVFLNLWRLDDDGTRVHHAIQGIQFDDRESAKEWLDLFAEQEPMGILDWLRSLSHSNFDAQSKLWNVFLSPSTFTAVADALREDYADNAAAQAEIDACVDSGEIQLHGRNYCRAQDEDESAHVFEVATTEDEPEEDEELGNAEDGEEDAEVPEEKEPVAEEPMAEAPKKKGKGAPAAEEL